MGLRRLLLLILVGIVVALIARAQSGGAASPAMGPPAFDHD